VQDVSVYVEVTPRSIDAFVRDRGVGFDQRGPTEGRGIAQSIEGRLIRIGGTATIVTSPGEGTEVILSLPLNGSEVAAHSSAQT
jgi:signal transduction histidine kinase